MAFLNSLWLYFLLQVKTEYKIKKEANWPLLVTLLLGAIPQIIFLSLRQRTTKKKNSFKY